MVPCLGLMQRSDAYLVTRSVVQRLLSVAQLDGAPDPHVTLMVGVCYLMYLIACKQNTFADVQNNMISFRIE